jgi:hypothetical protein
MLFGQNDSFQETQMPFQYFYPPQPSLAFDHACLKGRQASSGTEGGSASYQVEHRSLCMLNIRFFDRFVLRCYSHMQE